MLNKSKVRFKVKYKFKLNNEIREGIESEASWYLVDQQGNMYSYGPMKPIRPIDENIYIECEPLLKINDKWMSVDEIEEAFNDFDEQLGLTREHPQM